MKFNHYITRSLVIIPALLLSCTYDFPEPDPSTVPSKGNADFTKFISIGNSLTAGFMDGALYTRSQNNSFPSIMATQFALVGGGEFNQPNVNSENGCYNLGSCTQGRLHFAYVNGAATIIPKAGDGGAALQAYNGDKTKLNNFGIPGVTIGAATNAGLSANPYYARIASNAGTSTLIGDAATALANGGTFFSFWLGNNDVLGYATAGASAGGTLTSEEIFEASFTGALNAMLAANPDAKGIVGNIPDVTSIPFFTTVPYNPVTLVQAQVDQLNPGFAAYNGGLDAAFGGGAISAAERDARKIVFVVGQNPVTIEDEKLTDLSAMGLPSYRFATANDLVVLPASSFIGTTVGGDPTKVNGISVPLADQWIIGGLDGAWVAISTEKEEIQNAITAFNEIISDAVAANTSRLALLDAHTILSNIPASINGIGSTASLQPPYGLFSADGIHPNGRGAAFLANQFILAINTKFGANIPLVNPNDYPGNDLPVNP